MVWDKWTFLGLIIVFICYGLPQIAEVMRSWGQEPARAKQAGRVGSGAGWMAVGLLIAFVPGFTRWLPGDLPHYIPLGVGVALVVFGGYAMRDGIRRSAGPYDIYMHRDARSSIIGGSVVIAGSIYAAANGYLPYPFGLFPAGLGIWLLVAGIAMGIVNGSRKDRAPNIPPTTVGSEKAHGRAGFWDALDG